MGALDQLESFLQELLERPTSLLGHRHLQPLELASALTKELESRAVSLADRIVVPGAYEVRVAADDLAGLALSVPALEREMTDYVQRLALERDLSLTGPATVRIIEGPGLAAGQIAVRSSSSTRRHGSDALHGACLVLLGAGGVETRRYPLLAPVATLGRRSDNDVALDDTKVSRHHARIELRGRDYLLTDLDSTNGTRINGQDVRGSSLLRPDDLIEVGLQRIRFEVRA